MGRAQSVHRKSSRDVSINLQTTLMMEGAESKSNSKERGKSNKSDGTSKPKLIAFDLDYTLWPFWVDSHFDPPFTKKNDQVVDCRGHTVKYFPEVPKVLETLQKEGYILAVASRTSELDGAEQLIELFDWNKYFTYKEIYPGRKVAHFTRFKDQSGLPFSSMLFFDDEHRNIQDLSKIDVCSILVKNGVDENLVKQGLKTFASGKKVLT